MMTFLTVLLFRGAPLPDLPFLGVSDTFIEAKSSAKNFGRDQFLSGGPGSVILLRFEDLVRVLPQGTSFDTVQVHLTQALGNKTVSPTVELVQAPWNEGGDLRGEVNALLGFPADPHQSSDGVTWAGFTSHSIPLAKVKSAMKDGVLTLSNLADTFNSWRRGGMPNYGLALRFPEAVDFYSSEAGELGPRFEFTSKEVKQTANLGITGVNKVSEGWQIVANAQPTAKVNGKPLPLQGLGSGRYLIQKNLVGSGSVWVGIDAEDGAVGDNTYTLSGTGMDFAGDFRDLSLIRTWNEGLVSQERYSHARAGGSKTLNLVSGGDKLTGTGLRDQLSQVAKRLGLPPGGDLRDDTAFARQLPLSGSAWSDEVADQVHFPLNQILGSAAIGKLNQPDRAFPKAIGLRIVGCDEAPLTGPARVINSAHSEVVILDGKLQYVPMTAFGLKFGDQLSVEVVTPFGERKVSLSATEIFEASLRAGSGLPVVRVTIPGPLAKLDLSSNLAFGKIPTASGSPDGAALRALVDGDQATVFPANDWIEVDLGRDRIFGAVEVLVRNANVLKSVEVFGRETGQQQAEAERFGMLKDPAWHVKSWSGMEGGLAKLQIFGQPLKARTVRIAFSAGSPCEVAEVRVFPAKISP